MQRVDQIDNLHMARQQPLHQSDRPRLQRLGQQRVVGVGEGRLGDRPGVLPGDAMHVDQQAHQFGDADRRMGVVELDGDLIAKFSDIAALLHMAVDQVLQRGGGEEIFLAQPQLLPRRRGIAGIEHLGDRLRAHLIGLRADVIAGVEHVEPQRVRRARRP